LSLRKPETGDKGVGSNMEKSKSDDHFVWLPIYALGDYLQDPGFKDAIIDRLADICVELSGAMPVLFTNDIYPYTTPNSPHRQLAIDMCVLGWDEDTFLNLRNLTTKPGCSLLPEFLLDVVSQMGPFIRGSKSPKALVSMLTSRNPYKYHDHGGKYCCSRKLM
jgi:hypothetical protein